MADIAELNVRFPGGRRVAVDAGHHQIVTDQPREGGGEDSAPAPYTLFLASLAACAGFYAMAFCQKRGLSTDGLGVKCTPRMADGVLAEFTVDLDLPPDFPAKYREALVRAVDQCAVRRAIAAQPAFTIHVAGAAPKAEAAAPLTMQGDV